MWTHDRLKPRDRTDQTGPWQRKHNGHRLTLFGQYDGRVIAFGRDARPHLELSGRLSDCSWWPRRLPPRSSVDGELVTASDRASDVRGAAPEDLCFIAFAVPWWKNERLYDEDPTANVMRAHHELGLGIAAFTEWSDTAMRSVLGRGWEGIVIKEAAYRGWWRWKPTRTMDVRVSALWPGRGLHLGEVGSVAIESLDGRPLGRCAGMTDLERGAARVGMTCEVEYQAVGARGGLIHPRFLRWRDDL